MGVECVVLHISHNVCKCIYYYRFKPPSIPPPPLPLFYSLHFDLFPPSLPNQYEDESIFSCALRSPCPHDSQILIKISNLPQTSFLAVKFFCGSFKAKDTVRYKIKRYFPGDIVFDSLFGN